MRPINYSVLLILFIVLAFFFIPLNSSNAAGPHIINAVYDANSSRLSLTCNEIIQYDKITAYGIAITNESGSSYISLANTEVLETSNSSTVTIQLYHPKNKRSIYELGEAGIPLLLNIFPSSIFNLADEVNEAIRNFPVNYLTNNNPVKIDSVSYDATDNFLRIHCNRDIVTIYKLNDQYFNAIDYSSIIFYDPVSENSVALSGKKSVRVRSYTSLEIRVLPGDQKIIETSLTTGALKFLTGAYSIMGENGEGNLKISAADNVSIRYIPQDTAKTPVVTEAFYDATHNQLTLNFGNITSSTRGIDTTIVFFSGISIDDDLGGPNPDANLSGGVAHGIKSGVPKYIRTIIIDVTADDEALIESLTNKNSLHLILEPMTFFHRCYTKTGNGNFVLATGVMEITYQTDEGTPEIARLKYDFPEHKCMIDFNKMIEVSSFQPTGISIGGIQLTGGTVAESGYSSKITLDVNSTDQAAIETLPLATKANLTISVNANSFKNMDNIFNIGKAFEDGDTTATGETILVGYGRSFWDKSFEAFPTEDQLVPASLRAAGDRCYIYVADDQWTGSWEDDLGNLQPIISQTDVDDFLTAFEQSTPADNTKGIYDICREYFGEQVDTDGDSRIIFLFLNLRDEFGPEGGRNNRARDIPRTGGLLLRNELPVSFDPHSAETDMIYIDSEPIIRAGTAHQAMAHYFTEMIFHGVDPDEEQWLVEGMASLAGIICGYQYTGHRFPASQPFLATNNPLNKWTGWNGGLPNVDIYEFYHTSLFCLYMYEQFGDELIATIAADSDNGLQSIRNALNSSMTFEEVFNDFAVAGSFDQLNHPTYNNKYGFQAVDLGFPYTYGLSNFEQLNLLTQNSWTLKFFKVKNRNIPSAIYFTHEQGKFFNLRIAYYDDYNDLVVNSIPINNNQAKIDPTGITSDLFIILTRIDSEMDEVGTFIFSDTTKPLLQAITLAAISNAYERVLLQWSLPYFYSSEGGSLVTKNGTNSAGVQAAKNRQMRQRSDLSAILRQMGFSHYELSRGDAETGPFTVIVSPLSTTHYTDAGLITGQTYYYQIKAVFEDGGSIESDVVSATPGTGVSNLWSTATNRGQYGHPDQATPSCEWPSGSEAHYLWEGRFWIGAIVNGEKLVTHTDYGNNEWYPYGEPRPPVEGTVLGISTFEDSVVYDDLMDIMEHRPLGLIVTEKSSCFPETSPDYDDFIIMEYNILNTGLHGDLNDVFVSWCFDCDVAVIADPSDPHIDDWVDYDPIRNMSYMYDGDHASTPEDDSGESGICSGYIGVRLLSSSTNSVFSHQYWNWEGDPGTDEEKYDFMAARHPFGRGENYMPNPADWDYPEFDYRFLLSIGPINIPAGKSLYTAVAIVLGEGLEGLQTNSDYAKQLYDNSSAIESPNEDGLIIDKYAISQNYPNPFNPTTAIEYSLPQMDHVTIKIYNILGQQLITLVDEPKSAGLHKIYWNGKNSLGYDIASGLYFYKIKTSNFSKIKKMILLR